jgi:hypothetical protein
MIQESSESHSRLCYDTIGWFVIFRWPIQAYGKKDACTVVRLPFTKRTKVTTPNNDSTRPGFEIGALTDVAVQVDSALTWHDSPMHAAPTHRVIASSALSIVACIAPGKIQSSRATSCVRTSPALQTLSVNWDMCEARHQVDNGVYFRINLRSNVVTAERWSSGSSLSRTQASRPHIPY